MTWWQKPVAILRALFRKNELDQEMDEELRSHIELQTQQNLSAGMKPSEARRAALSQFGSVESLTWEARRNFVLKSAA